MAKKARKRSLFVRSIVILVSMFMIFQLLGLSKDLSAKRNELAVLNEELATKKASVDELKDLLHNGSKEQIIEKAARERLGFVYSNEEIYVDISGN